MLRLGYAYKHFQDKVQACSGQRLTDVHPFFVGANRQLKHEKWRSFQAKPFL